MTEINFISMFLLGLLGTGHCIGMCGPLVVALGSRERRWLAHIVYHTGRIVTYTTVGGILGAVGAGIQALDRDQSGQRLETLTHLQVGLSAIAAFALLAFGLMRLGLMAEPRFLAAMSPSRLPGFDRLTQAASTSHGPRLTAQRTPALMLFGAAMGLLPCGLSYAAFSRALAALSTADGAILTFAFGLGTLPGLLIVGRAAFALAHRYRRLSDIIAGLIMITMAGSLLLDALIVVG